MSEPTNDDAYQLIELKRDDSVVRVPRCPMCGGARVRGRELGSIGFIDAKLRRVEKGVQFDVITCTACGETDPDVEQVQAAIATEQTAAMKAYGVIVRDGTLCAANEINKQRWAVISRATWVQMVGVACAASYGGWLGGFAVFVAVVAWVVALGERRPVTRRELDAWARKVASEGANKGQEGRAEETSGA